jgi:chitinase
MVKFIPFIDTSVNAKWDDWVHYPNGRPNPLYSAEAIEWKVDGRACFLDSLSIVCSAIV